MENEQLATFSVSGWLPNGMKVYFTIPMPNGVSAFDQVLMFTNGLLEKGFAQTEPGLGKGEHTELIGSIARREKTNKDGSISTVLDLYAAAQHLTFRYMAVYLDTPEDVTAFENASGLKVASIPMNPTDAPPGKDNTKLVVKVAKPLTVIYVNNPDYDETNDSKKPKRLFVRWQTESNVLPLDTPKVEKSAADKLLGNGHDQPRNLVQTPKNSPVGANKGIWEYDLPALMAHPDLNTAYPQYTHRANAIKLLHDGGYFENVANISEAVKIVLDRPDKVSA